MRSALEAVVARSPDATLTGSVADLTAAGRVARRTAADVLLVDADVFFDEHDGLGPLSAATAIVALGMERHPRAAARARSLGARAFVVKDEAVGELPPWLAAFRRTGGPCEGASGRPAPPP
jgi:DNA-binding NarL/FixJ family response regulator